MARTTATPPDFEVMEGVGISLLNTPGAEKDDENATSATTAKASLRNTAAFWLLGLINNSGYVIMMAVAKDIAPGAVGVVFLVDVAPTFLIQLSAPYW